MRRAVSGAREASVNSAVISIPPLVQLRWRADKSAASPAARPYSTRPELPRHQQASRLAAHRRCRRYGDTRVACRRGFAPCCFAWVGGYLPFDLPRPEPLFLPPPDSLLT